MRAIILAAGCGNRLADILPDTPKCLLNINGKTLLQRHLENLIGQGIKDLDLVLGYQQQQVEAFLAAFAPPLNIHIHPNPDFHLGSVLSLLKAKSALESGDSVLVMDADVLCCPTFLNRLINSEGDNALLFDSQFELADEPVKICLANQDNNSRIVEFRKGLPNLLEYEQMGESVGFFKFSASMAQSLAKQCQYYIDQNMAWAPHEEAIRDLILTTPQYFSVVDVSGEPWIEIDFPEDVIKANELNKKYFTKQVTDNSTFNTP